MPKVAILLATFNGEKNIGVQLQSIQNQFDVDFHIYVSDDFSSDGTYQFLLNKSFIDTRLSILTSKKQGSAAKNFFRLIRDVDISEVDYVAFADQDDIWNSDKLSHAIKTLIQQKADAYSSNVTAFWSNGRRHLINKAQAQCKFDYMFESAGPGCTFVLKKSLVTELKRFLNNHQKKCEMIALHDWFIYAFSRTRGFKWFIDSESHMLYRQHDTNVVGANVGVLAIFVRWKKIREGWLRQQVILISELLGYSDMWPIKRLRQYSFSDRLVLIFNIHKFRRRLRDRIALALFLLFPIKL